MQNTYPPTGKTYTPIKPLASNAWDSPGAAGPPSKSAFMQSPTPPGPSPPGAVAHKRRPGYRMERPPKPFDTSGILHGVTIPKYDSRTDAACKAYFEYKGADGGCLEKEDKMLSYIVAEQLAVQQNAYDLQTRAVFVPERYETRERALAATDPLGYQEMKQSQLLAAWSARMEQHQSGLHAARGHIAEAKAEVQRRQQRRREKAAKFMERLLMESTSKETVLAQLQLLGLGTDPAPNKNNPRTQRAQERPPQVVYAPVGCPFESDTPEDLSTQAIEQDEPASAPGISDFNITSLHKPRAKDINDGEEEEDGPTFFLTHEPLDSSLDA
mmetsp:Transcript_37519/g.66856  ORF Transcript_37519/g.66856 Transcript_37519/m.66856 type:complete len:327 (-) Transcript_37519:89-1069(-)